MACVNWERKHKQHGKEAGPENHCGDLKVLLMQPGATVRRQITARP